MRPEDLGIAAFLPEPTAKEHVSEVMRRADEVRLRIRDLSAVAEAVGRDNVALKAAGRRLSVELYQARRALEEMRRHRAALFVLLVLTVLLR